MERPELCEAATDPIRGTDLERTIMEHHCPWCGSKLDLRDRTTWSRDCPDCEYIWIPGLVDD